MSFILGQPVIRVVEDKTFQFQKLKRRDLARLANKWVAKMRDEHLKNWKESNLDSEKMVEKLEAFDINSKAFSFAVHLIYQREFLYETILESLRYDNPTVTEEALDSLPFSDDELYAIALEIWGQKLKKEEDEESVEKKQ
jgi:hypothetical protein